VTVGSTDVKISVRPEVLAERITECTNSVTDGKTERTPSVNGSAALGVGTPRRRACWNCHLRGTPRRVGPRRSSSRRSRHCLPPRRQDLPLSIRWSSPDRWCCNPPRITVMVTIKMTPMTGLTASPSVSSSCKRAVMTQQGMCYFRLNFNLNIEALQGTGTGARRFENPVSTVVATPVPRGSRCRVRKTPPRSGRTRRQLCRERGQRCHGVPPRTGADEAGSRCRT